MSKLYKDLKYDTDYVMQPGDPITSFDGSTAIKAGNATGKGFIETYGDVIDHYYDVTVDIPQVSGASARIRLKDVDETTPGVEILSIDGFPGASIDSSYPWQIQVNGSDWGSMQCNPAWEGSTYPDYAIIPIGFGGRICVRIDGNEIQSDYCHWSNLEQTRQLVSSKEIITAAEETANKVLASPTSGTGAVSFRSLVAADIPDLSTSKLTTGTLGVARGGTGKISHTINSVIIGGISATGALQNVASASGAFYSTGSNKKPQFGTLPVAQGGTGVNGSSQAINKVLASPASGSAGAISFRSLTVADLPTGTTSSTVALGNHTHSDYVSKSATSNQTVSSEITMPTLTVGSRNSTGTVGAKSVSEGYTNTASGECSHAEGHNSVASEYCAHAEGQTSTASGYVSHAEGQGCTASGYTSHAEGYCNNATGSCSHAEGSGTYAVGNHSHAEGNGCNNSSLGARGEGSHVEGYATVAQNNYEHAQGRYNASHKASDTFGNAGNTLSSIGFSTDSNPKNAVEVMQDGKVFIYGMGGYNGTNPTGTGVKDLVAAISTHTHSSLTDGTYTASLPTLTANRTLATTDQVQEAADAAVKYALVSPTVTLTTTSAPNDTAAVTLVDHAVNVVDLTSSVEAVTFTFPTLVQGKARDFMVRLTIAGDVPTIYFQEAGGGSITFDADGETWTNIQPGANLIMFTETKQTQA